VAIFYSFTFEFEMLVDHLTSIMDATSAVLRDATSECIPLYIEATIRSPLVQSKEISQVFSLNPNQSDELPSKISSGFVDVQVINLKKNGSYPKNESTPTHQSFQ
jgi:hypothetical protein